MRPALQRTRRAADRVQHGVGSRPGHGQRSSAVVRRPAAGELDHGQATPQTRQGVSRHYPIPVAVLARLAVDHRHQHRGLGAALLRDALRRVTLASEQLAVRAVVVHAIDERAEHFYEHFGFRSLRATPRTLMVTLTELRAAGYP